MKPNRRSFIKYASLAAAGSAAGLRPFGLLNGLAETTSSYKALVCIFLYGGNDSNNTLVPTTADKNGNYSSHYANGYEAYAGLRGDLALSAGSLLTLGAGAGGQYGLHPSLSNVQTLFNDGRLAWLTNVGTLLQPTTQAEYQDGSKTPPSNLFSHPDQQLEWQNASSSAGVATGWGGLISDKFGSSFNPNAQIPLVTSVYGDTLFCNGVSTSPVSVSPGNLQGGQCSEHAACAGRLEVAQQLLSFNSGLSLVQADNAITSNSYRYMNTLSDAVQSVAPITTSFPANNPLAVQLQQIAQIMQVRQALGMTRQIFFAGLGNFDTHSGQLPTQAALLTQLSQALLPFYNATKELGLSDQVTTFTMSDFSRAYQPNSNGGSDHAWGGHHLVMGGAVKGGQIYGAYPTLELGGPTDSDQNGRWIPTISSSQYGATLASWFGVPSTSLTTIFPSLHNFSTTNLGFL